MTNAPLTQQLFTAIKPFIGRTPYVYGGVCLAKGVDCSAFSKLIMAEFNINLPRTSKQQSQIGKLILPNQLEPGDLVFFSTTKTGKINHVGIYLWQGWFAHATRPWGVMVSHELSYNYPILFGRRVIKEEKGK